MRENRMNHLSFWRFFPQFCRSFCGKTGHFPLNRSVLGGQCFYLSNCYHICFHGCKRYPTASALRFLAIQRTQKHQLLAQARGPTTCCEVLLQFSTQRFLCGFNLVVFFIPIHYCHVPRLVQSYVTITSAANLGGVHSLHCYVLKPQNQGDWVVAHLPLRCRLFACLFACLLARRKLRFRDTNSPN